jgi:hypothetical protein
MFDSPLSAPNELQLQRKLLITGFAGVVEFGKALARRVKKHARLQSRHNG